MIYIWEGYEGYMKGVCEGCHVKDVKSVCEGYMWRVLCEGYMKGVYVKDIPIGR